MRVLAFILVAWSLTEHAAAAKLTIDFESGAPPPQVATLTPLTPGTGLDFINGGVSITGAADGDGIDILLPNFIPMCIVFSELSLTGFNIGDGVRFEVVFGDAQDGNSAGIELFQGNSVDVKIFERVAGGRVNKITETVDANLANYKSARIDWVMPAMPGGPDRIDIEMMRNNGVIDHFIVDSQLKHLPGQPLVPRIQVVDVRLDPEIFFGQLDLDTVHIPEPSTIILLGTGSLAFLFLQRRALS